MRRKKFYWPALGALTAFFTMALFSAVALASGSQSIASDQPDYSPGSVVTVTGSGWGGDTSVQLQVDDNKGKTWSWSDTVAPDANGDISDTLTLPTNFVAEYLVTATGSPSAAVATTTFTDGAVQLIGAGTPSGTFTFNVDLTGYSDNACTSNGGTTTTAQFSTTLQAIGSSIKDANHNNPNSYFLHVTGTSSDGRTFLGWDSNTTTAADICAPVVATSSVQHTANFGAATPTCTGPTVTTNPINAAVTVGSTATFTAAASGTPAPSVKWQVDTGSGFSDISPPATSASYTTPATTLVMSGYKYRAVFTSTCGSANTTDATLTVNPPPDSTPPAISYNVTGIVGNNGWYVSNVTLTWTVTETESPGSLVKTGCVDQNITSDQAATTYSCSATSDGGSAGPVSVMIKRDATAPTASASASPDPNVNGWNNTDVTVSFTGTDGLSGIDSCSADVVLNSEGAGQSASGTCTDKAGNLSAQVTASGINIDKTAPTVAYTSASPSPNVNGWYKTDVVATFTATDTLSGFAGPSTTKTGTSTTSGEGAAVTVGSPAFTDLAGNTVAAGAATSDAFMIDKTAPTVSVTGFTDGDTFTTAQSLPTVGCSSSDSLSGIDTTSGPTVTAGGLNGNGVGSVTYSCGATDKAGNSNTANATFTRNYASQGGGFGFLQPINPDNTSVFSRGKSVPGKFQLTGDEYTGYSTAGWKMQQVQVSCAAFDTVDSIVEATTNSSAGWRYDPTADQYIYNADFRSKAVGTCWKLRATLDDPAHTTFDSAVFKLQK